MIYEVKAQGRTTLTMERNYKAAKQCFDKAKCGVELFQIDSNGRKSLIDKRKDPPFMTVEEVLKNNFKAK